MWATHLSFFTLLFLLLIVFASLSLCLGFHHPSSARVKSRPDQHKKRYPIGVIMPPQIAGPPRETDNLLLPLSANPSADETGPSGEESSNDRVGQDILALAIPALGALLIDPLMTLADTALVGRFADTSDQLAGMGSAAALLTFSFYLFNFFCTATTPLISARRSAGNRQGAIEIGGQALSLSLVLGSILTGTLIAASQPLLYFMGTFNTGSVANAYATDFLVVRALAAPAVLCISASTGILRGYLDTKTPIYILVFANLLNLALDFILIAQAGMGPMGAAIATTTAEWTSALAFLLVLAGLLPSADGKLGSNQSDAIKVTPELSIPSWSDIKPLLVASTSVLLRSLTLQLSLSAAAGVAARSSNASASVAAHQVALQLWLLCSFICDALAAASQGLVADALGREDQTQARKVAVTVFQYSIILGLLLALLLYLGDASLLNFFTRDMATQEELQTILAIIIATQPLNSLVFAADGVLQGASEFWFQAKAMVLSAAAAFAFFLVLPAEGDILEHVWWALIVLQSMRGLTSLYKLVQEQPINLLARKSVEKPFL